MRFSIEILTDSSNYKKIKFSYQKKKFFFQFLVFQNFICFLEDFQEFFLLLIFVFNFEIFKNIYFFLNFSEVSGYAGIRNFTTLTKRIDGANGSNLQISNTIRDILIIYKPDSDGQIFSHTTQAGSFSIGIVNNEVRLILQSVSTVKCKIGTEPIYVYVFYIHTDTYVTRNTFHFLLNMFMIAHITTVRIYVPRMHTVRKLR